MTVCPFCKKAVPLPNPQAPCPSCGRAAAALPTAPRGGGGGGGGGGGWDDDGTDLGGGLDLSRGSSMTDHNQTSAYSGGGLALGDDEDPFADAPGGGSLELDVPSSHQASTPRSMPAQPQQQQQQQQQHHHQAPHLEMPKPPRSEPSLAPHQQQQQQNVSAPPSSSQRLLQQQQQQVSQPPPSQPSLTAGPPQQPPPQQQQQQQQPRPPAPPDPASMIARYPTPPSKIWQAPIYAIKVIWRQLEIRQDLASLRKKRSPDVALYERALKLHDTKAFVLGLAITCATLAIASFVFFLPVILRFLRDPD